MTLVSNYTHTDVLEASFQLLTPDPGDPVVAYVSLKSPHQSTSIVSRDIEVLHRISEVFAQAALAVLDENGAGVDRA